jgi:ribonuclease D
LSGVEPEWRLIVDADAARRALEQLKSEPIVGLDTETYWDAADKRAHVSLVQIAPPSGEVLVFDALAMGVEELRSLVESPEVKMVAHNARFDELILMGAGLRPGGFIDTLRMSRMALDLPSYSLAAVSEHLLGLPLDKSLRTSNWRRRPLTRAQITYAATDARVTLKVFEELRSLLAARGSFEKALQASTLTGAEARAPRRKRIKHAPAIPLSPEEKLLVAHLKKWRLDCSRARRVPAYMICPDKTLEHLARERPGTLEELLAIHGLGESKIESFGEELLQALRDAAD